METIEIDLPIATTPSETRIHVSEGALLRVGGLPIASTERLKSAHVAAAIARSHWLDSALATNAQELSGLLHEAVEQAKGNQPLQHALLAIRRNVFNGRRISDSDFALAGPHLKPHTLSVLQDWRRFKDESESHARSAEKLLQESMQEQRKELRRLVCLPDFRKGLLLSSPSFERTLEDYVRSDGKKLDRKLRRTERTLLSYLLRTTHKTSPLSTLTSVCRVKLSEDPQSSPLDFEAREVRCAVKPNFGILSRVAQALTQNAIHHPRLRLCVKDGATVDGNRIKYWKRTETPVTADGPVHSRVTEHTFWIRFTPSIGVILRLMEANGDMAVAEIEDALMSRLKVTHKEATEYVRILVENGFLVVSGIRQSVFDPSYWSRFADELARMDDGSLTEVADGIRRIEQHAKDFEVADVPRRPRVLQAVETEAEALLKQVQCSGPLPRPVLYEDSRASECALTINRSDWAEPLADLAELQRLFSLFDPLIVSKATLKSLFKKRYGKGGSCKDLLEFSDFFHEVFYRPYQQAAADAARMTDQLNPFGRGTLNPLKLPEVTQILNARAELTSSVEDALGRTAGMEEFHIPAELVQRLGDETLPRHRVLSNSFFFQVAEREGEKLFVLNHVYAGFGCMYTRFAHLFPKSGPHSLEESLRTNIEALQDPDVLFAEIQGGHETNLNHHALLADKELVYPGERGISTPDRQIHTSELTIRHDAETDEVYLYCDRLGKRVAPLYLGMLYPLVLPELQMLLLHFSPPTVLRSDLSPRRVPDEKTVIFQPRMRYKHVVIERAKWIVNTTAVPARNNQEQDYDYLVRLSKWRTAAGIPTEVFVKIGVAGPGQHAAGPQKPFYLDFDHPFCVFLFEKLIADNQGTIHFSEMLPAGKDAILSHNGDSYTSEFVAEITQGCQL